MCGGGKVCGVAGRWLILVGFEGRFEWSLGDGLKRFWRGLEMIFLGECGCVLAVLGQRFQWVCYGF